MRQAKAIGSSVFYRPADVIVDAALAWLSKQTSEAGVAGQPAPFFMWVHLYDPHRPNYDHPELDGTKFQGQATYAAEVAFMDRHIGRLTAALDAGDLPKRTLIIAVADHGEGLENHGDPSHGMELYEESLRVPLLVSLPGVVRAGQRVEALVSLRDLFPTVLDVLGVAAEDRGTGRTLKPALMGESLEPQTSWAEAETPLSLYRWSPLHSLTTPAWKYIRTARPELYDRAKDRGEMYNLATVYPERVAELDRELAAYEAGARKVPAGGRVQLSEIDQQRMRDLGYLVGEDAPAKPENEVDLRGLRDIKDTLQLRIIDWTIRWGIDESTIDAAAVAAVAGELVRQSPESPGFHRMLNDALKELGQPSEAPPPAADSGAIRAHNEEPQQIVAPFRAAFADPAQAAKAHADAGLALAKRSFYDNSLGHYFEAARLDPRNAQLHMYMAQLFRALKRTKQTIEHLQKTIELQPQDAGAHYNLALTYTEAGDYGKAAGHYRQAIAVQPQNPDPHNNLGYVLARLGKPQEAEAAFREAIRLKPSSAAAHSNLADLLAAQKRYTEAVAEYQRVMELDPADSQAAAKFAVLLATCDDAAQRDPARALALAQAAVEQTRGRGPGALFALARVQAAQGRLDAAIAAASAAMPLAVFGKREELIKEIEAELVRYRAAGQGANG
jgi:Flp pilus assembly protein TadD